MSKYITLLALAGMVVFFSGIGAAQATFGHLVPEMDTSTNSIIIPSNITTTNNSGFTWTGYLLELDLAGSATFVYGSAQSTDFQSAIYPDAWTIEFQEPEAVLHGEEVTFEFKVEIPAGYPYTFTLTQTPIPEPATVVLLGLGTLALLTRTKK